ncbi:MAG: hypothetical protein ACUVQY_03130 [Thermoproteota archaeon]
MIKIAHYVNPLFLDDEGFFKQYVEQAKETGLDEFHIISWQWGHYISKSEEAAKKSGRSRMYLPMYIPRDIPA